MKVETVRSFDKDWRKVKDPTMRKRFAEAIEAALAKEMPNVDIVAVVGNPGHFRLRVGDYRILYRVIPAADENRAILIRLVSRGALEQAARRS